MRGFYIHGVFRLKLLREYFGVVFNSIYEEGFYVKLEVL